MGADSAQQIQADEQMGVDHSLAQQLQAPHSITVPRSWPQNGQIPETAYTPGACGSNDILLPDPNDPAAHKQLLPGNNRRQRRTNSRRRSESPETTFGHRHQLRLLLRAVIQFNFPLPTSRNVLGTTLSKMTGGQRKEQLEQGQLVNIVLDYALVVYTSGLFCDLVPRPQTKPLVNSFFSTHL